MKKKKKKNTIKAFLEQFHVSSLQSTMHGGEKLPNDMRGTILPPSCSVDLSKQNRTIHVPFVDQ
jgi:hypothetical protein